MNTLRLFVLALALAAPAAAFADSASQLCDGSKHDKQPTTADKTDPKKEQPKQGEGSDEKEQEKKPEGDQAGKS